MNCELNIYMCDCLGLIAVFCVADNEAVAQFLLQNGAGFSSYMLMDHPAFSQHLLRLRIQEEPTVDGKQVPATWATGVCVRNERDDNSFSFLSCV